MAATFVAAVGDLNQRLGTFAALANVPAALAWSAREIGAVTADPFTVTDAELALIADVNLNRFTAIAEWRSLEVIYQNADDESLRQIGVFESAATARAALERRLMRAYKFIVDRYDFELDAPTAGSIALDFAAPDTWT